MTQCQSCRYGNDKDAVFCEQCGVKLEPGESKSKEFCENCGMERGDGSLFCEECGTKFPEKERRRAQNIRQETSVSSQRQALTEQVVPTPTAQLSRTKKKLGTGKKISLVLLVFLVIGAGAGFFYLKDRYSEDKQIDALIEAMNQQDEVFLVGQMVSNDRDLKITQEGLLPMFAHFKNNKEDVSKMKEAFEHGEAYQGFKLKETKKQWGLFPTYKIEVTPIYTTVTSNMDGSVIKMNGETIATSKGEDFSQEIGPLIPGEYTFIATVKEQKETRQETVSLMPDMSKEDIEKVDMSFQMTTVGVYSNLKNGKILLNGEEVGEITDTTQDIGPFLWREGMMVEVVKETENGEVRTEKEEIKKPKGTEKNVRSESMNLLIREASEADAKIGLRLFYDDFKKAVDSDNSFDASAFADTFYDGGEKNTSFTGIGEYIQWCRDRSAKGEYRGVTFSVEVTSLELVANDTYNIDYHVMYYTSYPYKTGKKRRDEGFDYTGATVKLEYDEGGKRITGFQFVNMGDGGVKVSDNMANE